jgi:ankyrin repeat protein
LILESAPDDVSSSLKQKVKEKKKHLFDKLGAGGWNAFHFAIFSIHNDLVKEFVTRGADCNKITLEGWSPLQLAVYKDNFEGTCLPRLIYKNVILL